MFRLFKGLSPHTFFGIALAVVIALALIISGAPLASFFVTALVVALVLTVNLRRVPEAYSAVLPTLAMTSSSPGESTTTTSTRSMNDTFYAKGEVGVTTAIWRAVVEPTLRMIMQAKTIVVLWTAMSMRDNGRPTLAT